ncbi:MAG: response regulator [bacterium]|nr:response regulator [bacterium]
MAKILIAEDDLITRKILVKIIEDMGHTSIQSSNGRVAFTILCDNPDIDILVTDVMMPEMTGRDLLGAIRQRTELDQLATIIISGVVGLKEISDLLDHGASVFCPKPIKAESLRHYIDHFVNTKGRKELAAVAED